MLDSQSHWNTGNEKADEAEKAALCLAVTDIMIWHFDFKANIKEHFQKIWQTHWESQLFNNLLHIKPPLGITKFPNITSRHHQVVLRRLRLGHTYLITLGF